MLTRDRRLMIECPKSVKIMGTKMLVFNEKHLGPNWCTHCS